MFRHVTYGLESANFKAMRMRMPVRMRLRANLAIIFMFPFTKGHSVYLKAIKSKPEAGIQTHPAPDTSSYLCANICLVLAPR